MLRPSKRVFQLDVAVERAETEIRQSTFQRLVQAIGGGQRERASMQGQGEEQDPIFRFQPTTGRRSKISSTLSAI